MPKFIMGNYLYSYKKLPKLMKQTAKVAIEYSFIDGGIYYHEINDKGRPNTVEQIFSSSVKVNFILSVWADLPLPGFGLPFEGIGVSASGSM